MPMTEGQPPDPDNLRVGDRVRAVAQQVGGSGLVQSVLLIVITVTVATAQPPINYIGLVSVILLALTTPRR